MRALIEYLSRFLSFFDSDLLNIPNASLGEGVDSNYGPSKIVAGNVDHYSPMYIFILIIFIEVCIE